MMYVTIEHGAGGKDELEISLSCDSKEEADFIAEAAKIACATAHKAIETIPFDLYDAVTSLAPSTIVVSEFEGKIAFTMDPSPAADNGNLSIPQLVAICTMAVLAEKLGEPDHEESNVGIFVPGTNTIH